MTDHPNDRRGPSPEDSPVVDAEQAHVQDRAGAPVGSPALDRLEQRLADASLSEPATRLLRDALHAAAQDATTDGASLPEQQIYLGAVTVEGFRGIGPRAHLVLDPKPGVTLVVGRNGSGKSSFAEGVEVAFTGRTARLDPSRSEVWRSHWRNLHDGDKPKVEARIAIGGDPKESTLTCTWPSGKVTEPEVELRRPGHGRRPFTEAGWATALRDYRPFLSYADLEKVIGGKPSELYDSLATILGLGDLAKAAEKLAAEDKTQRTLAKQVSDALPALRELLAALDDPRAQMALIALDTRGGPDLDGLDALVAGLPDADDDRLARLRAVVALTPPDLEAVGSAVDRLRGAQEALAAMRASGAESAHVRATLLEQAMAHREQHPDEAGCPVCGSDRRLDAAWAAHAAEQIAHLRQEAAAAAAARTALREAADALRYLVAEAPAGMPAALARPWGDWAACRRIDDAEQLADTAEATALTLAEACATAQKEAARELTVLDESWRGCVSRLAAWCELARRAAEAKARTSGLAKARTWLREATAELREEREKPYREHTHRIWCELRQQSNVALGDVSLSGTDRSTLRKLVMDVLVDGEEASALGVMSQGELHSLALSLFLPRAAASDSPFGFVMIDDPVQSMDPAKVHGLATVLHELGRTRQIVVFTHDIRLQRAFSNLELPVTVREVSRNDQSRVTVRTVTDPIKQALSDARAIAKTPDLPAEAAGPVLYGLCRSVLERAFTEVAWRRLHRDGVPEHTAEEILAEARKLTQIAAVAYFGDSSLSTKTFEQIKKLHGAAAVDVVHRCQNGAHGGVAAPTQPLRFIQDIADLAESLRAQKGATP